MSRLRILTYCAVIYGVIPAAAFWAAVMFLSVGPALLVVAAWIALTFVFARKLGSQNVTLAMFSTVIGIGVVEMLLRSSLVAAAIDFSGSAGWEKDRLAKLDSPVVVPDTALGYRPSPGKSVHAVVTKAGTPVYDVVYSMDSHGFRVTRTAGGRPVLVLGDSFNFGEGLNNDETLATYLARQSFQPVNLSAPGYGPHQVLRQLQIGVPDESGIHSFDYAFLSILDDHIERAAGKMPWLLDSPRYELSGGDLRVDGSFRQSKVIDKLLAGSRLFAMVWKVSMSDPQKDRRVFVEILRHIKSLLAEKYGAELVALYYSGSSYRANLTRRREELTGRRDEMFRLFCEAGISFIDVSAHLPDALSRYFIADDGHPTAELNAFLASLIAERGKNPALVENCKQTQTRALVPKEP